MPWVDAAAPSRTLAMPALAITTSMPPNCSTALIDGRLHGGQIADVGDGGEHAVLAESAATSLSLRLVEVGQHQLGALVVQSTSHFRADAVARRR